MRGICFFSPGTISSDGGAGNAVDSRAQQPFGGGVLVVFVHDVVPFVSRITLRFFFCLSPVISFVLNSSQDDEDPLHVPFADIWNAVPPRRSLGFRWLNRHSGRRRVVRASDGCGAYINRKPWNSESCGASGVFHIGHAEA